MKKFIQNQSLKFSSLVVIGLLSGMESAHADGGGLGTFNDIADNAMDTTGNLPGLVTGVSYMLGILFAVLGVLKVKDHVENPSQTPLKEGVARVTVGGGLFAVPIVTESMSSFMDGGTAATGATQATVDAATIGVN